METLRKKLKEITASGKRGYILPIMGIAGILLIALSSCGGDENAAQTSAVASDSNYCTELEEKISRLVGAITGDGDCIVAVTLENSGEYVYADQNKTDTDHSEDTDDGSVTTKKTEKTEQEYIIVQGANGVEEALVVTEKKPGIRGVAIVSRGLNEINLKEVLSSVSSMLGISDRKISISQKAE